MLVLAGLALFLKILIPPGYMAAPVRAEAPAFALVLCTPQGMVTLDAAAQGDHGAPDPTDEDGARHSPCAFSGHGVNAPPPVMLTGELIAFAPHVDRSEAAPRQVVPGRGLAAPPPPARGPPPLQA